MTKKFQLNQTTKKKTVNNNCMNELNGINLVFKIILTIFIKKIHQHEHYALHNRAKVFLKSYYNILFLKLHMIAILLPFYDLLTDHTENIKISIAFANQAFG